MSFLFMLVLVAAMLGPFAAEGSDPIAALPGRLATRGTPFGSARACSPAGPRDRSAAVGAKREIGPRGPPGAGASSRLSPSAQRGNYY